MVYSTNSYIYKGSATSTAKESSIDSFSSSPLFPPLFYRLTMEDYGLLANNPSATADGRLILNDYSKYLAYNS